MKYPLYAVLILTLLFGTTHHAVALTVSPPKVEMAGAAGTTIHGEIKIFNEQKETRTFFSSFENFEPSGDSGAPHFIGARDGLATWLSTDAKITVESGETKIIPFSVTVPANTEPGGYFAAVFWGSQAPNAQAAGDVSVGGKIGVLVLLRVAGEVQEKGGLLEFGVKDGRRFFSSLPISFAYRVNNEGGDRVVPLGDIKIRNTLRMLSANLSANKNEGSVLPGSARKFLIPWGVGEIGTTTSAGFFEVAGAQWDDFRFGWYTANLHITWGTAHKTADASYGFFVFPWQLLSIVLSALTLIGLSGFIALKKYNRWIIAQAGKKNE